jgi:hypothetical protein
MRIGYNLVIVVVAALMVSTPLWPVAPSDSKSTNPCVDCHTNRSMYLDILEGNAGNNIPTVIDDGQTLPVAVVLKVTGNNVGDNDVMSSISATLESQNGHFKVETPTYNIGSLQEGKSATARWTISVLSNGTDVMLITAKGTNTHNSNQFSDSYSPPPAITVNKLPPDFAPSIALTAPAAGQTVTGGTALDVAWTASDEDLATCLVNLYYSTDNFASSNVTIATGLPASQGYSWTTPRIDSTTVRLKATVRDLKGHFNQSVQGGVFAIDSTAPSVVSVRPSDGASDVALSAPLQVKFSEPVAMAGAQAAFSISPDPGSVAWSWDAGGTTMTAIHAPFADGTAYACTVSAGVKDLSSPGNTNPGAFSWSFRTPEKVIPVPTITVTSPSGGERLYQGDQAAVRWTASGGTGALLVNLSISQDGAGGTFSAVATGIANTGLYVLTAPNIASDNCVIKATVYDQNGKEASATSGAFSVAKPLSLTADLPRAGARLRAGTAATLAWAASGGHGTVTVTISFQQEAGSPMQTVFSGLPGTGDRTWTAPQADTATARFAVSAVDDWGTSVQAASGLFSIFTNRAPRFTSSYMTTGEPGSQYAYQATAVDDDGDALTFSLLNGPAGMTVDGAGGKVAWTPSAPGDFPVVLKVSDGMGGEAFQEFSIHVAGTTVIQRPSVEIFSPAEGQKVKGNLTVSGAASGGTLGAAAVQVRVDSGEWVNASGTRSWQLTLDTRGLQNGAHTIEIRAYDGSGYSDPVTRTVNVDNTAPSRTVKKENTFTVLDWLILAIFVLVIIALVYLRRKK